MPLGPVCATANNAPSDPVPESQRRFDDKTPKSIRLVLVRGSIKADLGHSAAAKEQLLAAQDQTLDVGFVDSLEDDSLSTEAV